MPSRSDVMISLSGPVQLGPSARDGAPARLEDCQRGADLRHRLFRRHGIKHNDIRRIADANTVIVKIHQPCRALRQHGEAFAQLMWEANLANVGLEIGDSEQRAVTKRRERVEHIVRGEGSSSRHAQSEDLRLQRHGERYGLGLAPS